jgi:phage FluMu gp28-like protein
MPTATEFAEYVKRWCKVWNEIAKSESRPQDMIPKKCIKKTEIVIPHQDGEKQSRLFVKSSNPDAAAGFGGDLILDEFALHKQADQLMTVAGPLIAGSAGTLTILSTHRSKTSLFNQYVKEAISDGSLDDNDPKKMNWSHHKTTIKDALDQDFLEIYNSKAKEVGQKQLTKQEYLDMVLYGICKGDEARFEQEFMCVPSEQQFTLLPWELCLSAVGVPVWNNKGSAYLGWDVATSYAGDFSCITVVQRDARNTVHLLHQEVNKGLYLVDQRKRVEELVKEYKIKRLCVDSSGLGVDSYQLLERKYGSNRVEGINFTQTSKHDLASRMLGIFQANKLIIPEENDLIVDLNSMEKVYTKSENITYHAPHINGSHGDRFWSLAMALKALGWERSTFVAGLESEQKQTNNYDDDDDDWYEDNYVKTPGDFL